MLYICLYFITMHFNAWFKCMNLVQHIYIINGILKYRLKLLIQYVYSQIKYNILLTQISVNTRTHYIVRREKELDTALPAWSGQTGLRDRSDRSPVRIGDGRRTRTREGPRQGRRT